MPGLSYGRPGPFSAICHFEIEGSIPALNRAKCGHGLFGGVAQNGQSVAGRRDSKGGVHHSGKDTRSFEARHAFRMASPDGASMVYQGLARKKRTKPAPASGPCPIWWIGIS